jgi:hypothetical protein
MVFRSILIAVLAVATLQAGELELKPETLKAWDEYLHSVAVALQQQIQPGGRFLWADENPQRMARLRAGEIVVAPAGETNPKRVPSGLIYDWVGAAFIPHAHIANLLSVVRDYSRYKELYKPDLLDARLLRQTGLRDEFELILRNLSFLKKTAFDGVYESSYFQLDAARSYSITTTTRVQEIEDYGGPREHKLPVGQGNGYIWRLSKITRFEERDGGLYYCTEAIALSREIPAGIGWIVGPIVRREARQTLAASIERLRGAVQSAP